METKRLDLGDGDYALALAEMTHRTHKAIERLWVDTVGAAEWKAIKQRVNEAKTPEDKAAILKAVNLTGDDEVIILNQVTELSIGGVKLIISQEILDNMASSKYQTLAGEVDKLYTQVPLVQRT